MRKSSVASAIDVQRVRPKLGSSVYRTIEGVSKLCWRAWTGPNPRRAVLSSTRERISLSSQTRSKTKGSSTIWYPLDQRVRTRLVFDMYAAQSQSLLLKLAFKRLAFERAAISVWQLQAIYIWTFICTYYIARFHVRFQTAVCVSNLESDAVSESIT